MSDAAPIRDGPVGPDGKKAVELFGGMIQIINRDEGGVRVTIKAQRKE